MIKPDNALYRCDQIKACEQQAMTQYQIDEHELMARAGMEAFFFMQTRFPQVRRIAVFCGAGNNAGDGYVLARLAHEQGFSVVVYQCKALEDLPFAARNAAIMAINAGVECQSADDALDSEIELIVDALLGTGITGSVRGVIATAIQLINASDLPVLSLDLPSGLQADTGVVMGSCVKATATLTFIAAKAGMYTQDAPDYCGEIQCRTLQTESCLAQYTPFASLLTAPCLPLPARKKNSHKGDYGHVLIIGGGRGMPGAVSLAAKAALRTGAGMVSIATWPDHARGALPLVPEAMVWGVNNAKELDALLANASVCVIGPGLGETEWAQTLFLTAIRSQLPMIIDASALRLLAQHPQTDDNWVLTPHPGEASALLGCSVQDIQKDRYQAAATLQQHYGGVVVLKGVGTIVQSAEKTGFVCPEGNPGMATAGMGDVLSGIIAGFAAQGFLLSDAAKTGVWVHAAAGDRAASTLGETGLIASDLLPVIPEILRCSA